MAEFKKRGVKRVFLGIWGAASDILRNKLGFLPPLYGQLYGSIKDGSFALNYFEENGLKKEELFAKHPKNRPCDWRNAWALRGLFEMSKYKPGNYVKNINLPILYISAKGDRLCPTKRIWFAHENTENSEILEVDMSHFGIYLKGNFEKVVEKQLAFMRKLILKA